MIFDSERIGDLIKQGQRHANAAHEAIMRERAKLTTKGEINSFWYTLENLVKSEISKEDYK